MKPERPKQAISVCHPGALQSLAQEERTSMNTVREEAHKLVDQLPDEASWDDLMYQIYVRKKIEAGRQAIAGGRVFTQEEAEKRMAPWLDDEK
jgi:hypothetical protein